MGPKVVCCDEAGGVFVLLMLLHNSSAVNLATSLICGFPPLTWIYIHHKESTCGMRILSVFSKWAQILHNFHFSLCLPYTFMNMIESKLVLY